MRTLLRPTTVLLAAALVFLSACGAGETTPVEDGSTSSAAPRDGGGDAGEDEGGPDGEGEAPTSEADAPPAEALRFVAPTVAGGEFDGTELAGEPAVLWFWAPWCAVCRGEASVVAEARREWGDRVTFLGVSGHGGPTEDAEFVTDHDLADFTHARDTDGALWSSFGVVSQPAFAFISADGTVQTVPGALSPDDLDSRIAALANG
ncbi:redoxin domain-containing protein [Streptomyces sp. ST2-7A]|uniref:redoxin domain-containing protein n=1 Tax=Streptomyces sp. ST2-7A TaxID=2907214 RepID=UPI001F3BDD90|nr:redoxin domain-containing protein [Streptomyces sp. ST2-7A]MCE7079056.1 redoxin domain-containing protein [Streptomyces sp. ST2-7A]